MAYTLHAQVVTFDDGGVSHHANHVAAFRGVLVAAAEAPRLRVVLLVCQSCDFHIICGHLLQETVPVWRKFLGVIDAAWLAARATSDIPLARCGTDRLVCFAWQPWRTMAAMWMHRSQFVWCGWQQHTFALSLLLKHLFTGTALCLYYSRDTRTSIRWCTPVTNVDHPRFGA